jgi:hypothetical protein
VKTTEAVMLRYLQALCFWTVILPLAQPAGAQQPAPSAAPPPAPRSARPFEIRDNSFLVEEAFNQERGILQNIATYLRAGSGWAFGFTQEWPIVTQRHQFSYTLPVTRVDGATDFGDVLINYRLQALAEGPGRPAFSPRVSVILPTGDPDRGTGDGVVGWQFNLPVSKQKNDFYFHANTGLTILPGRAAAPGTKVTLTSPAAAGSVIWRLRPMVNLLVENVFVWLHQVDDAGKTKRTGLFTLSPGVRGGWNAGETQIILGAAAPVTWRDGGADAGIILYLSYELPFRK